MICDLDEHVSFALGECSFDPAGCGESADYLPAMN
jgi:hypothetical protein